MIVAMANLVGRCYGESDWSLLWLTVNLIGHCYGRSDNLTGHCYKFDWSLLLLVNSLIYN